MPRICDIALPDTLVASARAGDAAAHEAVYAATAGAVYTLLRRLVRRPAIAEELRTRVVAAPRLSERQLRRIVYG